MKDDISKLVAFINPTDYICSHFYVVALKLEGKEPSSPDSYENDDLVTYAEAQKSSNPQPYIAAVLSKNENMFILGDDRNTSNPTSRRRRSTSSDYYNGPLEPGTSYGIFQRIFINKVQKTVNTVSSKRTFFRDID